MSYFKKYRFHIVVICMFSVNVISCTAPKTVIYFNNLKDTSINKTGKDSILAKIHSAQSEFENPIQKNDQLWITVGGSNLADLLVVNSATGTPAGSALGSQSQSASANGFLVEANGKIKLPYLGLVQAEGLTRIQFEAFLTEKFKDYTKDPVVNVRYLNYNFSVLGEVLKPGRYPMPTERTTILEAISLAGDIGELGKRDNILLIREVNGQRDFIRINLLSKDLFSSSYFYLKTNDVIYVEPVKSRFITRAGLPQYLSIIAVSLSLLITIINVSK